MRLWSVVWSRCWPLSATTRFLLPVLLVLLSLTLAACLILGQIRRLDLQETQALSMDALASGATATLAEPLRQLNQPAIELILQTIGHQPDILCAELLHQAEGLSFAVPPSGCSGMAAQSENNIPVRLLVRPVGEPGGAGVLPPGRLLLVYSQHSVMQQWRRDLAQNLTVFPGLICLGLLLVHASESARLYKPLQALLRSLGHRAPDVPRGGDPLGALTTACSQMAADIALHHAEMDEAHRQAEAARQAADKAEAARSDFLAVMSHELRTPLHGILATTALLQENHQDGPDQAHLQTILSSARMLLTLLDDILDFTRLENGSFPLITETFSPHALLEEVRALVQSRAQEKGLTVLCQSDPGSPDWLSGDPLRLCQCLLNLTSNALKFTEEGCIEIRMEKLPKPVLAPDQIWLSFLVSDTGCGISDQMQARLFRPFSPGEHNLLRRQNGAGLGLAICRQLAELQGGALSFSSEPGHGSQFRLTLPFRRAAPPAAVPIPAAAAAASATLRILLAEDSPVNRSIVQCILEPQGHELLTAGNGRIAVEILEKDQDFDLILMDIHMPELNGLDATRTLKGLSARCAALPVVGLTAAAFPENRQACLAAGMTEVLAKPFTPDQLLQLVSRYTPGDRQSQQPESDLSAAMLPAQPSAASDPEPPLVDPVMLQMLRAQVGDAVLLGILEEFSVSSPTLIAQGSSPDMLPSPRREAAHQLKGACAMLGLSRLHRRSHQIELACAAGMMAEAGLLCQDWEQLLLESEAALRGALDS